MVQASGGGLQVERHPNIQRSKHSLQKAAADFPVNELRNSTDGHKDLRTVCVLMMAILNNYIRV